MQPIKPITQNWTRAKKASVESGKSFNWDVPILCCLIEGIIKSCSNVRLKKFDSFDLQGITPKNLRKLIKIRNTLKHLPGLHLEDKTFKNIYEKTVTILITMGNKRCPLLMSTLVVEESAKVNITQPSGLHEEQAKKLLKAGSKLLLEGFSMDKSESQDNYATEDLLQDNWFVLADTAFSKAIEIPNISSSTQFDLHFNRSEARLNTRDFKGAKTDALFCVSNSSK